VSSPLTDLLAQPGATAALVAAAKQFVLTVVAGGNEAAALQSGLQSLGSNPLFSSFSLNSLLSDPNLPQAVGGAISAMVTGVAADAEVQAAIGARLSGYITVALGNNPIAAAVASTVSDAVVGLLADSAAVAGLSNVAGTAVTVVWPSSAMLESRALPL
jgi:hypothetical protein